jgi:hypothetical protein
VSSCPIDIASILIPSPFNPTFKTPILKYFPTQITNPHHLQPPNFFQKTYLSPLLTLHNPPSPSVLPQLQRPLSNPHRKPSHEPQTERSKQSPSTIRNGPSTPHSPLTPTKLLPSIGQSSNKKSPPHVCFTFQCILTPDDPPPFLGKLAKNISPLSPPDYPPTDP